MRFMMLMIPNLEPGAEWTPSAEDVATMGRYNDELTKAGILLALDGLHPIEKGARVAFEKGGKVSVFDGPFAEAREVIGGYWVIQASSKDEAVQWASRCPSAPGSVIEVRQVFELEDFPADVQAAGR
ncbi:MAG: YciI family protein [Candidatus Dormiibacterota bacterium]